MCKQLLEVVVQGFGLVGQHRQRSVVTHGACTFFAVIYHRLQHKLEVFLRVTKGLLRIQQIGRQFDFTSADSRQFSQVKARLLNPLTVRFGLGQCCFDFFVINDATLLHVDQQHFAWLQAPFFDDFFLRERNHAHLGSHHDNVIFGHQIAGRTQTVTVQCGTDHLAIGKGHRSRAIPWLHQRSVVFVEGTTVFIHQRVTGPGFRNQHHHGMRQAIATRHQQFQTVVETGGVRLTIDDQWPQLFQVFTEHRRFHGLVTRSHPVDIALHSVDFTVVGNHAERMGQIPGRESVGGETLVHQRQRGDNARVFQILVVNPNFAGQQHTFVDNGA